VGFRSQCLVPLVTIAALAAAPLAYACDSTGCLLVTRGQNGVLRKGGFSLDLSFRWLDDSRRLNGSDETDVVIRPRVDLDRRQLVPGFHNDLSGRDSGVQLDFGYGLGRKTTVYTSLPLFTHQTHDIGHGGVVTPYDIWGIGDVVIGVRQSLGKPVGGTLVGGVAGKLPTGRTSLIDPYDLKPLDPSLQPGSGSWDALFSTQYARRFAGPGLDTALSFSFQANAANDHEYQFGNEAIATLALSRAFGSFTLTAQTKYIHEARDDYRGQLVSSTGAEFVYVAGGLRYATGRSTFYSLLQAPVHTHVNETQLAPRWGFLVGVSRVF